VKVEHWDQMNPPAYTVRPRMCEKCWNDAFSRSYGGGELTQSDWYGILLADRKDQPCAPKDQAGEWWNEQLGIDERWLL